jgi:hypothetical protein
VARRLEIELTSARPDGTWTWRAAGALNPRGSLDSSLLYSGAKVGDVVRAEAEFGIEGITVVVVEPPRAPDEGKDDDRIQLLERPAGAAVTTQLVGRARPDNGAGQRRRHDGPLPPRDGQVGRAREPRPAGPSGSRRPAPGRRGDRPVAAQDGTPPPGEPAAPEPSPEGRRPQRGDLAGRRATGDRGQPGEARRRGEARAHAAERGEAQRQAGERHGAPSTGASARRERAHTLHDAGASHRQRRLNPGNAHRNALLESLPPEQQPIAQQLLRGGIPAVRTALHFERERAREEGRPEPSTEGVIAIAESLVGRVKAAEWRDRAEAALKAGDDLATRDLRALVTGSDVARDEASRELASALRDMLERRVEALREAWSAEVARHLDEAHALQALRLSARAPDPGARLSAELAVRLRDAASEALSPDLPSDRWLALLLAVSESPVRRAVKPVGLPKQPTPELMEAARQHCGRVPGLAPLLGLPVPPPPGPLRHNVAPRPGQRSRGSQSRRLPRPSSRSAPPRRRPGGDGPAGEAAPVAEEQVAEEPAPTEQAQVAEEPAALEQAVEEAAGSSGEAPVHDEQPSGEALSLEEAFHGAAPREGLGVDAASAFGLTPLD